MTGEIVLAVDDRAENTAFLRQYVLEPNGYKVIIANNGVDALNIALSQPIDLIISDLMMPKMSGLELLENLREAGSSLPAILTTLYGSEETAVKAFRLGARDYIMKPYTVEEMLDAVNRALTEARLRQERDSLTENLLKANRQMESRVKELQTLYAIGHSVSSLLDLEQILNRIVEAAIYLSGAEEGSIMLLDESNDLYLRAARGLGDQSARSGFRVKVHDNIAGQVVRTGQPIIIGAQDDEEAVKFATQYFVKSMINVPLKLGNRAIGVLVVNTREKLRAFNNRHLNLLSSLADYASIAIENARLHAQVTLQGSEQTRAREPQAPPPQIAARSAMAQSEMMVALGNLAAGLHHDLAPALAEIARQTKLISAQISDQAAILAAAAAIEREQAGCQQMLRHLNEYAGQEPLQQKLLDLNEVLDRAWRRIETDQVYDTAVEVLRGYDPALPQILGDRRQLEQAFYYVLEQALKSTKSGSTLHIITRAVNEEVQVIITDAGQTLSSQTIKHLFDPYYKTPHHDYGLGLSITFSIIERHNGTIEVDSKDGQGTTFTIRLSG